jgi:hypothetical protein
MGARKGGRGRARGHRVEGSSDVAAWRGRGRASRAALLAGASLIALGVFAAPAQAACSGPDQIISTSTAGPIVSNGGAITVTNNGIITGLAGLGVSDGVDVGPACPATTVANSGSISGAAGGAGVSNSDTIGTLTNSGTIAGGAGGGGSIPGAVGAGVFNAQGATIGLLINESNGTITSIDNQGLIGGEKSGDLVNAGSIDSLTNGGSISGGAIGAGVANSGTITTLSNTGKISGGAGGVKQGTGGAGVSNSGTVTTLSNSGTISGGRAAKGDATGAGGAGGAGVSNSGTITSLTNTGTIGGGDGGSGVVMGGAGGAGVSNSDMIATLVNSGTIAGGAGGGGGGLGAIGAGVLNAQGATIVSLVNEGAGRSRRSTTRG